MTKIIGKSISFNYKIPLFLLILLVNINFELRLEKKLLNKKLKLIFKIIK
jgi:hypothetical protein